MKTKKRKPKKRLPIRMRLENAWARVFIMNTAGHRYLKQFLRAAGVK